MLRLIEKIFTRTLKQEVQNNKLMLGKILSREVKKQGVVKDLKDVEFKVFSQWGDDGIIQYLIHHVDIPNKTFIEFGVEDYTEANTRFLIENDNWSGLIMDGSEKNMAVVKNSTLYWKHDLQVKSEFITAENINDLIKSANFEKEVGLLHIDIDGNDYYIWKAIDCITPVIVIVEYNSVFGPSEPLSTIYESGFFRTKHHFSNLLYGASITSLCDLANEKGYAFIGCNSAGNNAYFVRKDKLGSLPVKTTAEGYVESKFREGRNSDGSLSFLRGSDRLKSLKGQSVFNTRLKKIVEL